MKKSKIKPTTMKIRTLKKGLAEATREICEQLYTNYGATKVYEYANKTKMCYDQCNPCDAETPTISDSKQHTCAICGTGKDLTDLNLVVTK